MHLLAIDPAARMGLARWRDPDVLWSGIYDLEGSTVGDRLEDARDFLNRKLLAFANKGEPVDAVYCEETWQGKFSNPVTVKLQHKLEGIIEAVCARNKVRLQLVRPETWRGHFIGRSKAPKGVKDGTAWLKKAVRDRCRLLGWEVAFHDESDALGILDYARSQNSRAYQVMSTPLFSGAAQ
ncbi:hypothetical protein L1787_16710 [Acuticoccus sp. M5D2P5]|uniref:hypothetical protein n=1 Tax=Acuticoccus kalidii TaxID=2910977 RepID=UPI001F1749F5|nr:hypothetical protein [Acuticoccus kalidii]MCF3935047.1 hypothetical protein [Acuticoccus kalidii]